MIDNNVIIDGSETNIIDEQHRNKDEERVGGGKLLVQRYTPSKHLVHNAAGSRHSGCQRCARTGCVRVVCYNTFCW